MPTTIPTPLSPKSTSRTDPTIEYGYTFNPLFSLALVWIWLKNLFLLAKSLKYSIVWKSSAFSVRRSHLFYTNMTGIPFSWSLFSSIIAFHLMVSSRLLLSVMSQTMTQPCNERMNYLMLPWRIIYWQHYTFPILLCPIIVVWLSTHFDWWL